MGTNRREYTDVQNSCRYPIHPRYPDEQTRLDVSRKVFSKNSKNPNGLREGRSGAETAFGRPPKLGERGSLKIEETLFKNKRAPMTAPKRCPTMTSREGGGVIERGGQA